MAAPAYTLEQAKVVFNNTIGHRNQVLRDRKDDPKAYKKWLETHIEELGRCEDPTEVELQTVERYIHYWMACDVICKERAHQLQERQARLRSLIKDFEGMKNSKQPLLSSPFRGDTLFGHTLTKPSQVKGLERVISACK